MCFCGEKNIIAKVQFLFDMNLFSRIGLSIHIALMCCRSFAIFIHKTGQISATSLPIKCLMSMFWLHSCLVSLYKLHKANAIAFCPSFPFLSSFLFHLLILSFLTLLPFLLPIFFYLPLSPLSLSLRLFSCFLHFFCC